MRIAGERNGSHEMGGSALHGTCRDGALFGSGQSKITVVELGEHSRAALVSAWLREPATI